jgi:hypothetical protein
MGWKGNGKEGYGWGCEDVGGDRGRRQEAGMRSYCAARAQAQAWPACNTGPGLGFDEALHGEYAHSRHRPTRPSLRVRRVRSPSSPISSIPNDSQAAEPAPAHVGGRFRGAGHG